MTDTDRTVSIATIHALTGALRSVCEDRDNNERVRTAVIEYAFEKYGIPLPSQSALAGFQPPMVTVSSLFERAATAVDAHQFPPAAVLLGVVAEAAPSPLVAAYRALAEFLAELDRAGADPGGGVGRSAWLAEADLRSQVFDLLARGPDAPAPTGTEQF